MKILNTADVVQVGLSCRRTNVTRVNCLSPSSLTLVASNMPPQPTRHPGALAGHWVPNYNNGLLAVDVEGDRYGDGVQVHVSFIFSVLPLTSFWL